MDTYTISHIVNFSVMGFVLFKLGKKPAAQFFSERSSTIKKDIDEAEEKFSAANGELNKWQGLWEQAGEQSKKMFEDAKVEMEKYREKVLAAAQTQAERVQRDTELVERSEEEKAVRELRKEVVDKSLALASTHLVKVLGPEERKKIVLDSLELVGNK